MHFIVTSTQHEKKTNPIFLTAKRGMRYSLAVYFRENKKGSWGGEGRHMDTEGNTK